MVDRVAQNILAQKLYEADPGRISHGDSACWVAACFAAYALLTEEYTAEQFNFLIGYYGPEVIGI